MRKRTIFARLANVNNRISKVLGSLRTTYHGKPPQPKKIKIRTNLTQKIYIKLGLSITGVDNMCTKKSK